MNVIEQFEKEQIAKLTAQPVQENEEPPVLIRRNGAVRLGG